MAAIADLLLERLAAEPGEAGLFLDFDGVLAPIVERPEDAAPPPETRAELERLVQRYALVAVVSGRAGDDVRARLGMGGVVCVGSHGLELEPQADRWRRTLAAFAADAPWPQDEIEVKGLAVSFHFRGRDEAERVRNDDPPLAVPPVVLGAIALKKHQEGLAPAEVPGELQQAHQDAKTQVQQQSPRMGGILGSVMGDIMNREGPRA